MMAHRVAVRRALGGRVALCIVTVAMVAPLLAFPVSGQVVPALGQCHLLADTFDDGATHRVTYDDGAQKTFQVRFELSCDLGGVMPDSVHINHRVHSSVPGIEIVAYTPEYLELQRPLSNLWQAHSQSYLVEVTVRFGDADRYPMNVPIEVIASSQGSYGPLEAVVGVMLALPYEGRVFGCVVPREIYLEPGQTEIVRLSIHVDGNDLVHVRLVETSGNAERFGVGTEPIELEMAKPKQVREIDLTVRAPNEPFGTARLTWSIDAHPLNDPSQDIRTRPIVLEIMEGPAPDDTLGDLQEALPAPGIAGVLGMLGALAAAARRRTGW